MFQVCCCCCKKISNKNFAWIQVESNFTGGGFVLVLLCDVVNCSLQTFKRQIPEIRDYLFIWKEKKFLNFQFTLFAIVLGCLFGWIFFYYYKIHTIGVNYLYKMTIGTRNLLNSYFILSFCLFCCTFWVFVTLFYFLFDSYEYFIFDINSAYSIYM